MPSAIEWTEETWNPVVGCSKVSPGCAHCYAETIAKRFGDGATFPTFKPWTPENAAHNVTLKPDRLEQPLHWRRPRMVFVNSMSDLFHEEIPDSYIAEVFATMAFATRHTFQVLTKRPERARDLLTQPFERGSFSWITEDRVGNRLSPDFPVTWPLPNVWLGVSIENMRWVGRADTLRETPAAVRFVSAEPLLGPLIERVGCPECWDWPDDECAACEGLCWWWSQESLSLEGIDWLIVGGESGPGARPMDLNWARDLVEACDLPGVAPFVKQLGSVWAKQHTARGLDCGPADKKGGDPRHWPPDLRVREMPWAGERVPA
jgi:protein gp37